MLGQLSQNQDKDPNGGSGWSLGKEQLVPAEEEVRVVMRPHTEGMRKNSIVHVESGDYGLPRLPHREKADHRIREVILFQTAVNRGHFANPWERGQHSRAF